MGEWMKINGWVGQGCFRQYFAIHLLVLPVSIKLFDVIGTQNPENNLVLYAGVH